MVCGLDHVSDVNVRSSLFVLTYPLDGTMDICDVCKDSKGV